MAQDGMLGSTPAGTRRTWSLLAALAAGATLAFGFRVLWRAATRNAPRKFEHVCRRDDVMASAMLSVTGPASHRYTPLRERYRDDVIRPAVLAILERGPAHSCAVARALRDQGNHWSAELDGFILATLWRADSEGLVAVSPRATEHSVDAYDLAYDLMDAGRSFVRSTCADSGRATRSRPA